MFTAILLGAPKWVWPLLVALIALGISQSLPRTLTLRRATLVPVALVGFSLYGVSSTFGGQDAALLAWALAIVLVAVLALAAGAWSGIAWLADERRLRVPGSWWPMLLIVGLFVTKFAVGVALAMQPAHAHDPVFSATVGAVYGAFSGMFLSRGLAMWRVAHASLTRLAQQSA
jgi:hypothetical protein